MPDAPTPRQLAARLRSARSETGLTQQQVADWLGVRRPAIAEVEAGVRAVRSEELVRMAALYGRSIGWLVDGEMGVEDRIAATLVRADGLDGPALRREAARLARRCSRVLEVERELDVQVRVRAPEYAYPTALDDFTSGMAHGREVAYQERARLGFGTGAPLRDPWGVVENGGIFVLPVRLGGEHPVDALFVRPGDGRACVGVNIDKGVHRQVFAALHGYGHAIMDEDLPGEACATGAGWSRRGSRYGNRELRANQFAAVFLAPREALLWFLDTRRKLRGGARPWATGLTALDLVRARDQFGASTAMLLWRLQNEGLIAAAERRRLRDELDRHGPDALARSLGYERTDFAQPFHRAREVALRGWAAGRLSLGGVAEIFDLPVETMRTLLRRWGLEQEAPDPGLPAGDGA